jgi:hypothetical protein
LVNGILALYGDGVTFNYSEGNAIITLHIALNETHPGYNLAKLLPKPLGVSLAVIFHQKNDNSNTYSDLEPFSYRKLSVFTYGELETVRLN